MGIFSSASAALQTFWLQSEARSKQLPGVFQATIPEPVLWSQRLGLVNLNEDFEATSFARGVNVGKFQERISAGDSASTALQAALAANTDSVSATTDLMGRALASTLPLQVELELTGGAAVAKANSSKGYPSELQPWLLPMMLLPQSVARKNATKLFLRRAIGLSVLDANRIGNGDTNGTLVGTKASKKGGGMKKTLASGAVWDVSTKKVNRNVTKQDPKLAAYMPGRTGPRVETRDLNINGRSESALLFGGALVLVLGVAYAAGVFKPKRAA